MWEKKVLTYCAGYYGTYENLEEAKEACKKDLTCPAIYDSGCKGRNFRLCPQGYTEVVSSNSCLFIKSAGTVLITIMKMNILHFYYLMLIRLLMHFLLLIFRNFTKGV